MQDRLSAIFILLILGVCCLGLYVAFSGYLINSLPAPTFGARVSTLPPMTLIVVLSNTDVPKPTASTALAIPSPLGAFQTITAAITSARPTVTITPRIAIPTSASLPTASGANCAAFTFCPQGGMPDSKLAPTGAACPRNYIWGQVIDLNKRGLSDARIRFRGPLGDLDNVTTKGPPDPPGIYNILAPSGTWTIWMIDVTGNRISPEIVVTAQQTYTGTGNCPTRADFVQSK